MNMQTEMVSHFFMKVAFGPFYQLVCRHQLLSQRLECLEEQDYS